MSGHVMQHAHYPAERLRRLVWAKARARRAQMYYEDIGAALVLDIIDGETTGDRILDFALVACNGTYDIEVVRLYHDLHDVVLGNPHHQVLAVQEAEHWHEYEMHIIRTIFVGELRLDNPEFNIDKQLIGVPVERGYLVYRELLRDGVMTHTSLFVEEDTIMVGPLTNQYTCVVDCYSTASGALLVPPIAPSAIYVHPWTSEQLGRHGIDQPLYRHLMHRWLIGKTKLLSNI